MPVLIDTDMLVDLERGVTNPNVEDPASWKGQVIGAHDLWIAAAAAPPTCADVNWTSTS